MANYNCTYNREYWAYLRDIGDGCLAKPKKQARTTTNRRSTGNKTMTKGEYYARQYRRDAAKIERDARRIGNTHNTRRFDNPTAAKALAKC